MGFQGAARDPLQHALPFLFSDPQLLKETLRYTLREVRADGSLPYGIVGHGVVMPTTSDNASDLPLWLLWTASEYVLATRDAAFLDERITGRLGEKAGEAATVKDLLARCYHHLVDDVRSGDHGLMRMLQDDWNDAPGHHLGGARDEGMRRPGRERSQLRNGGVGVRLLCPAARRRGQPEARCRGESSRPKPTEKRRRRSGPVPGSAERGLAPRWAGWERAHYGWSPSRGPSSAA